MKFSTLSYLVAGAGLFQANASPLRVTFVGTSTNLLAKPGNENVAQIQPPVMKFEKMQAQNGGRLRGCAGARFREKAVGISNTLRQALGLPLIHTEMMSHSGSGDDNKHHFGGSVVHILPFHGTPSDLEDSKAMEQGWMIKGADKEGENKEGRIHRHHHHHPHAHFHHKGHHQSFMRRIHFALLTLGPWEGRAVAFVIGCGLGVLLRMFWVLAIVSYRALKGEDEEEEYVPIPNQLDAEEIFVAPPVYVVDEKAPLKEEMKAAEETN